MILFSFHVCCSKKHKSGDAGESTTKAAPKLEIPFDYVEQSVISLPSYVAKNAPAAMEVLETSSPEDLECVEMGDGNLNLVFIVTNTKNQKRVIVKQVRTITILVPFVDWNVIACCAAAYSPIGCS